MRDLVRQIVDKYKSLKLEGQEQGYVIFSGQDPDSRESVLIKILPRMLGEDPRISQRFQALARSIRQLNHPNIVSVRKVGEEAGLPYLVTRTLEKVQPLAAKLDQPWAVDAAADVVMQVGAALEHAYSKGIVQGGLSPEDIVMEDNGRVYVANLGLNELLSLVGAKARDAASPFLAPERAAGQPAQSPADVYSLAAVLYSLLAHRPPEVVAGQVLPPSRFNGDVPEAMDQVVVKALSPDPSARYPDVRSFLAALGSVSLLPRAEKAAATPEGIRCPRCVAPGQTGRFCRRCGTAIPQPGAQAPVSAGRKPARRAPAQRAPGPQRPASTVPAQKSVLDEPIQITHVDVGRVEVGKGIEVQKTVIAQPMTVGTGEVLADFPNLLPMPQPDLEVLKTGLEDRSALPMPQPPPMPVIDWAEVAPPMPEVPTIEDIAIGKESD